MNNKLQIVSFDVPYPVNYGGVIDVFYKLKALSDLGVDITLHTFEYGRGEQKKLETYCSKVYYYKRKSFSKSVCSLKPFIVKTRESNLLLERLKDNNTAILFEGLHTTLPLLSNELSSIKTLIRTHNIEHNYYYGLFKSEKKYSKKMFFYIEALKLKKYEKILKKTNHILTISPEEQDYFHRTYGEKSTYVPVFSDVKFPELKREEAIVLWHGDLRVSDNVKAALFAINVVKNTSYKLVIASSKKNKEVVKACKNLSNVIFDNLLEEEALTDLLLKAKVNVLFTYQGTGIKLKLLNALTKSRFVIANGLMVNKTGLEKTCEVANSIEEVRAKLKVLMNKEFSDKQREERKIQLKNFECQKNAKKIIDLLC